jgi:uncharacterized protein (TIGR02646 family)
LNKSFPFKAYKHPDVKAALELLFHNKCAYCETRYGTTHPVEIEHWRPKGEVRTPNGIKIRPGFYWLAAEWDNLLPSCIDCNRARTQELPDRSKKVLGKANQFPVDHPNPTHIKDIECSAPLLLNPCLDDPSQHIEFLKEGVLRPQKLAGMPSRKALESIQNLRTEPHRSCAHSLRVFIADSTAYLFYQNNCQCN